MNGHDLLYKVANAELLTAVLIAIFFILCAIDSFYQERRFPSDRFWKTRGIIALIYFNVIVYYAPFLWDHWFAEHSLFAMREWPFYLQLIIGFLLFELGIYLWHRIMHAVPILWRFGHQLHHSAERIDVYGAFYFHPIDILGFSLVGSLSMVLVLGLSVEAAILIGFAGNCCALLQHTNIRTPKWLGYFVMRPEAHALHHQRDRHYGNFGDIPLWDAIFGTYTNPDRWQDQAGFFSGSSQHLASLLAGKDLSRGEGA